MSDLALFTYTHYVKKGELLMQVPVFWNKKEQISLYKSFWDHGKYVVILWELYTSVRGTSFCS